MKIEKSNNGDLIIEKWKEFEVSKLFTIKSPASRSIKKYDEGDTPYVSSGSVNNGIVSYLSPKEEEKLVDGKKIKVKEKLEEGNCITVSPLDGSSFYQENDFLGRGGAGSAISLLYNSELSKYNALFICTVIKKASSKFGYSDALTSDNLKTLKLKLPTLMKKDGTYVVDKEKKYSEDGFVPDWNAMEEYMKEVEKIAQNKVNLLM